MNCPICGQPNECGIIAFKEQGTECWCFNEKFPMGLLEQVPEESRGKSCICRQCTITYNDSVQSKV